MSKLSQSFSKALGAAKSRFGSNPTAIRVRGSAYCSKHRQFDIDGNHIPGRVRLSDYSSLRKLMRAARRGKLPEERLRVIEDAQQSAAIRWTDYLNSSPRKRYG